MAKEKKANTEVAAEKSKGTNMLSIVIIALLVILIIGVGVFATFFLLNQKNQSSKTNSSEVSTKVDSPEFAYEIKESTLNLADENEKRYIKIKLYLDYGNKKLEAELKKKDHVIKDSINSIIRSKTSKSFTEKGTEEFKKEIIERVNSVLTTGKISDVSIYDILVQ